ncbi:hypothetical protein A3K29_03890 [Candidatus Collierbacteria bacterium RIFOXYB2_FULL_46_14]|uniref:Uncharacterized protein n=1 Tax=Candidatus Collierbacteria bacterium GW2011_GWA2_46_26 TaxID=1618381 RepID=A0A0G1PIQ0_9BACT|nr:MAG: hypothetical protein UW29_C0007G0020 [Candidatus Collierbacteria bacterium GW2011_GWC2_44_13]KKU32669.1 MAG: hypothetical protein UX47_C0008G0026 [Candidatus Collierbacteria bacterium GW2011_GWA2_46_26]OGD73254.1 MAG: hypothetical protein A3K29_03890 [Candidatus Collierbacteria bacterium RIFOXYB2_FULL_46_14]OGD76296.1 MAG: hypothetical protein A3K43_03890 [Candidatus Collierbacteria bacterium RIFOXYA2_FULL_46_20]OGD77632.1 MAG: hypothetical protein A3K39_03890 [Candidatus Collierbacteri
MESPFLDFAHTELAEEALRNYAGRLQSEDGIEANDAMRMAATVMDGAGDREGATVESVQTCMDLLKKPVRGLSSDDNALSRRDEFADSARLRHFLARRNMDLAGFWLKLVEMDPGLGRELGNRMQELVDAGKADELRFGKIFYWKYKEEKELGHPIPDDLMIEILKNVTEGIGSEDYKKM